MPVVRRLLAQRNLAWGLCLATLLLRLLVPTGFMIGSHDGRLSIELCSGVTTLPGATAMPAGHGMHHGSAKDHDRAEMPCAFSALAFAALGAVDPIQLAALLAFVMATGVMATALPAPAEPTRLRPPLRGPPATL